MSTLHQYKWLDLNHCQQRLHYMADGDDLLIYGHFTQHDQQLLIAETAFLSKCCFWLHDSTTSASDVVNINYQQWLTLITEHDKTHTWK